MGGFMMGTYFVVIGISQYLGSVVANYAHIPANLTDPIESLNIYTSLFNKLGFAGVGCTLIALAMLPLLNKLSVSHSNAAARPLPPPSVVGSGESPAIP
jgi:POT family proton-dependent oligopeptide transporter